MRIWLLAMVVTAALGCEKHKQPRFDGPMPVTFGDCAAPGVAFVSGPRPLPFTPAEAQDAWTDVAATEPAARDTPPPPEVETGSNDESGGTGTAIALDEGKMGKKDSDRAEGQYRMARSNEDQELARAQAIEAARIAGTIDAKGLEQGGAFASLTGTGDISSGFDDSNIYGGLLGNEAGEMNGGFGYGRSGFGPGGGGTGWGTIGTGRYGTIGHGSGTGTGYGVGGGRGGMRGRTAGVPTVSIGQPNAQGDLDKAIIRRYIKRNIQKIEYCYEKQLLAKPGLSGTVNAQFFITPNGNVSNATGTGVDPEVSSCVADVIQGIEFPKPKNGGGVQVNYPFTFRPAAGNPAATSADSAAQNTPDPRGSAAAPTPNDVTAGSGSAVAAGSGSAAAPPPGRLHRLFRNGPGGTSQYQPGALSPLRAQQAALTECLRRNTKHYGGLVVELSYDASGNVTRALAEGVDNDAARSCIIETAKKLKGPPSGGQRCSMSFGVMPASDLPALEITTDSIRLAGKEIAKSSVVASSQELTVPAIKDAIASRVTAATAASAPVVSIYGPLEIRAADATPMRVVNRAIFSVLAGGDDFVLATQAGADWETIVPLALPVVPVPFGTGGVWNHVKVTKPGADGSAGDEERVRMSVLVQKDKITIGLSRVDEFHDVPRDPQKLAEALKEEKASAYFADRTDLEIAGADDASYVDVANAIRAARAAGFTDWQLTTQRGLSAIQPR